MNSLLYANSPTPPPCADQASHDALPAGRGGGDLPARDVRDRTMVITSYARPHTEWLTLGGVTGLHVLVVFFLLSSEPAPRTIRLERPLVVSLIEAPQPEAAVEPPTPLPARPMPAQPTRPPQPMVVPPVLAVPESRPAEIEVAPAPPEPVAMAPIPPPIATPVPVPVASAAIVTSAPPPVEPPRFDADYLDNPAPAYPPLSRRLGEQGEVLLRVHVEANGSASRIEIRKSSGFERLDQAAAKAVRTWRFAPARQGGNAVAAWVVVPVSFSVRS